MKGRKLGSCELTLEDMKTIVDLTLKGHGRSDIAKKIGRCNKTVYLWQKKLLDN